MSASTAVAKSEPRWLLEVDDLFVSYGKVDALTGVALRVAPGEIVTVIGPNGAGKTTLLSALMGVLPARGRIVFDGAGSIATATTERRVQDGLLLVPETRALFSTMSIEDNLVLGAFRFRRDGRRRRTDALEEIYALFPRLKERRTQIASTLSGGERQMLALGRALMARPRLLMLDEPSLGLAPLIVREIFRIIADLRRQNVSILLVEQNARAALHVADRAYVLELGKVTAEGPAQDLARDPKIVETYLGLQTRPDVHKETV